jgi:hypothetical protein
LSKAPEQNNKTMGRYLSDTALTLLPYDYPVGSLCQGVPQDDGFEAVWKEQQQRKKRILLRGMEARRARAKQRQRQEKLRVSPLRLRKVRRDFGRDDNFGVG